MGGTLELGRQRGVGKGGVERPLGGGGGVRAGGAHGYGGMGDRRQGFWEGSALCSSAVQVKCNRKCRITYLPLYIRELMQ